MGQINRELMRRDAPIGVFDSGVGGLTVAREIMRQIPNEKIIYFGDTARVPYGSKSRDCQVFEHISGQGHCGGLQHGQRLCHT